MLWDLECRCLPTAQKYFVAEEACYKTILLLTLLIYKDLVVTTQNQITLSKELLNVQSS